MLEDNHIDNLFRSALEPFEATPSEKVWSSLDAALSKKQAAIADSDTSGEEKKKKRRYLFLLLALVVGSLGAYEYFSGSATSTKHQVLSSKPQTNATEAVSSNMTITSSHELTADNSAKAALSITEKSRGEAMNSQVSMNGAAVRSSSEKLDVGISKINSKVKNSSTNSLALTGNRSSTHSVSTVNNSMGGSPSFAEPKNSDDNLFAKANTNEERKLGGNDNGSNNSTEPSAVSSEETNNATAPTASNPSAEATENTNSTNGNGESSVTDASTETRPTANTATNETPNLVTPVPTVEPAPPQLDAKPPIGNSLTKLTVAGFYSPELASRYFTSGSSSSSQSSGTTSNEKFGYSYNTGAMFRYDISASGKWSIGVGCSFSSFQQITSVNTSYIIPADTNSLNGHPFPTHGADSSFFNFTSTSGSQNYTFNSNCGTVHLQNPPSFFTSHSNMADTVKFNTNTTIQLKYINVPVTIRYSPDFLRKGRFSSYANAGVSFSFLVNKQAKVVIGDAANSYSETSSDISGLRSMYYGWIFGIGGQYQFYKGFSVFVEPNFRGSISSITDNNSQSFYPYSLGVNTGVSYHF